MMTLPEAERQFAYWKENPPLHELAAMFARVFTTWRPPTEETLGPSPFGPDAKPGLVTPADLMAAYRKAQAEGRAPEQALETRWKSGAMNPADLLELYKKTGGKVAGMSPLAGLAR